jgi:hypothetical protein
MCPVWFTFYGRKGLKMHMKTKRRLKCDVCSNTFDWMLTSKCIWMNTSSLKCSNVIFAKKHFIWNDDWQNTYPVQDTNKGLSLLQQPSWIPLWRKQMYMYTHSVSPQCEFKGGGSRICWGLLYIFVWVWTLCTVPELLLISILYFQQQKIKTKTKKLTPRGLKF